MSVNLKLVVGDVFVLIQVNDVCVLIVDDLWFLCMFIGSVFKVVGFINLDYVVDGLDVFECF